MTTIIFRYLTAEVFKSSLGTMLVLFIILMSNTLSGVLADISLGEAPEQALVPILLRQATSLITLLIPFGFFLGVVFAFGRLYKDYEMSVLNACGMGYKQMLKPVLLLVIPFFCIDMYFSLSLSASSQRYAENIVADYENLDEFEQIEAGRFNVSENGDHVFYMEGMSEDRSVLTNVIISEAKGDKFSIGIADKGVQVKDDKTGDLFLELSPGMRYEGFPGEDDFKVIAYETHGVLVDLEHKKNTREVNVKELPFLHLLNSNKKEEKIELQWRLATPFALIFLAIVAVPLSYLAPRKGRYGKMGIAIVVYLLYTNALGSMLVWIEKDQVALAYGFWLVHGFFLIFALGLIYKRNGGFKFRRTKS